MSRFLPPAPCRLLQAVALAVAALVLAGCGFQLRGTTSFPFETLSVPSPSALAIELKRNVAGGSNTKLVEPPAKAAATLEIYDEYRDKTILSLNSQGRVREFRLRYRIGYRLYDDKGQNMIPRTELLLTRDISFNDSQVLAKESEEVILYREMQSDMVQQLLRRMAAAKPAEAQ